MLVKIGDRYIDIERIYFAYYRKKDGEEKSSIVYSLIGDAVEFGLLEKDADTLVDYLDIRVLSEEKK